MIVIIPNWSMSIDYFIGESTTDGKNWVIKVIIGVNGTV